MSTNRSRVRRWWVIGLGTAAALLAPGFVVATPAHALPPSKPAAVVSLGDSYISGEGALFDGMPATKDQSDIELVDRAHGDFGSIFGQTWKWKDTSNIWHDEGCHRSDSAPVEGVQPGSSIRHINLACSGAQTSAVRLSTVTMFKGEPSQTLQLLGIAQNFKVKAVYLSIGGNDFGFGDIIKDCMTRAFWGNPACNPSQDLATRQQMGIVMNRIGGVIDDIRSVMGSAGYSQGSYKLIVANYPTPIATGAKMKSGPDRNDWCNLYPNDATWVHETLIPRLSGALRQLAHAHGAQFMDLRRAFDGHELCTQNTLRASDGPLAIADAEWVNGYWGWVSNDVNVVNQSFHPNHFGQLVLQECYNQTYQAAGNSDYTCSNAAGERGKSIGVTPMPDAILPADAGTPIFGDRQLLADQCISSGSTKARLCFQSDGNLVVYDEFWNARWSIGSQGAGRQAWFQGDGNLVVYNSNMQAVWTSGTWGNPGAQLYVQNDGNVVIYNPGQFALWATGTNH